MQGSHGRQLILELCLSVYQQYMSIISVHYRALDKLYDDLQVVISSVPSNEVLLVMGDFNARVGCVSSESLWDGVQGSFGVGNINESGE